MYIKITSFVALLMLCNSKISYGMEEKKSTLPKRKTEEKRKQQQMPSDQIFQLQAAKMIDAVMTNNTSLVKKYIEQGYPVIGTDKLSQSIIGGAAFLGNVEMTKALLEAYPNNELKKVNTNCFFYYTTDHNFIDQEMHFSTANNCSLPGKKREIERVYTAFGYSPLHWACANPQLRNNEGKVLQIVELLLAHGANPSYSVSDLIGYFKGNVPIEPEKAVDLAYQQGFYTVAKALRKAEKKNFQETTSQERLQSSFEDFMKEKEKEKEGENPAIEKLAEELFIAAKIGNLPKVRMLLAQNAPITYINEFDFLNPLSVAANNGNVKVVKALLTSKANPNFQHVANTYILKKDTHIPQCKTIHGPTALHALCRNNNLGTAVRIKIATLLLANGARTDLKARDPRIITRSDRGSQHYEHPADLVQNCPELVNILREKQDNDTCLIS